MLEIFWILMYKKLLFFQVFWECIIHYVLYVICILLGCCFSGPPLVVDYFHVQNLTAHSIIKQGQKIVVSFNP